MYGCGCWADERCGVTCSGVGEEICKHLLSYEYARLNSLAQNPFEVTSNLFESFFTKENPIILPSPMPKCSQTNQVGMISLNLTKSIEGQTPNFDVELMWSHSTPSFIIGYFSSTMDRPKAISISFLLSVSIILLINSFVQIRLFFRDSKIPW